MVVGPPYPFVDGGGDLTCSQGGVGRPWVLVSCGGLVVLVLALAGPRRHVSCSSVARRPSSDVVVVVLRRFAP